MFDPILSDQPKLLTQGPSGMTTWEKAMSRYWPESLPLHPIRPHVLFQHQDSAGTEYTAKQQWRGTLPPDSVCCTSILVLYPRLVTRSCLTPLRLLMAGKCSRVCHYFVVRRQLEALRRLCLLSKKCSTLCCLRKKCSTLCCLRSSRCTSCPTTVSGGRWASQHVVSGTQ